MEFTKFDMLVLIAMPLAIISMSFVFPALGLTANEDQVNATDIPEFNVTTDRFAFADDLPEFPIRPDQGVLHANSDEFDDIEGNIQEEIGENSDGNRTFLVAIANDTVHIADVVNGSVHQSTTFTADNQTKTLSYKGFNIDVHSVDISNNSGKYEYHITDRPGDSTAFGSLINSTELLVNMLGFIFVSIVVVSQIIVQFIFNAGYVVFQLAVFFVDFMGWMSGTYGSIIAGADSWAGVFVLVPSIILFFTLGKLSIIIVKVVYPFA